MPNGLNAVCYAYTFLLDANRSSSIAICNTMRDLNKIGSMECMKTAGYFWFAAD